MDLAHIAAGFAAALGAVASGYFASAAICAMTPGGLSHAMTDMIDYFRPDPSPDAFRDERRGPRPIAPEPREPPRENEELITTFRVECLPESTQLHELIVDSGVLLGKRVPAFVASFAIIIRYVRLKRAS